MDVQSTDLLKEEEGQWERIFITLLAGVSGLDECVGLVNGLYTLTPSPRLSIFKGQVCRLDDQFAGLLGGQVPLAPSIFVLIAQVSLRDDHQSHDYADICRIWSVVFHFINQFLPQNTQGKLNDSLLGPLPLYQSHVQVYTCVHSVRAYLPIHGRERVCVQHSLCHYDHSRNRKNFTFSQWP